MTAPLSGLRVVELASELAGPYAGKLLADAGADVIKIEHPAGGDPMRRWTTTGAAIPFGEDSALFRFLNTSKRSVALDWTTASGRAQLHELATDADVVIETLAPTAGLEWATVSARSPRAVMVSVSPFGRTGPWADRAATEFTLQAWAGSTYQRGVVERPPLAAGGRLGEWLAGGYAAVGALVAAMGARQTGRGQHLDLSLLEVIHLAMAPFTTVAHSLSGATTANPRTVEIPSIEPCADGYTGFCTITNQQWRDFLVLIEQGELVDDPELANYFTRNERRHEVYGMIHAWTQSRTQAEIIAQATLLRIPVAPIGNGETVTTFDHFRTRGAYVAHPATRFLQPRPPYRLGRGTLRPLSPAPALGAHTAEVLAEAAGAAAARTAPITPMPGPLPGSTPAATSALPLAGLRVLDFTMFWAGPFVGHFLATLGADVIKIESIQRPDGIRIASTQQAADPRWWEWSGMFHGINANKRGITLDLSRPTGLALMRRLCACSDALIENYSPRVLDNLGLRYDDLARAHPGFIMLRMPAFGLDGPWRDRTGFAQTMEQVSGMAWVTGFTDGAPTIPRGPCDPLAGMHAVMALLVALEHRRRTGEGQLVESTMVEAALNATADQMLEWQAYGTLARRDGNRGPVAAPQNLYACRGDEQWLALAVATDGQWRALVEVLGHPSWASAPGLATAAGRRAAHDQIDVTLAAWCASQDLHDLVERLLGRGIPAAPVLPPRLADRNPQMRARGFFEPVSHPVTGTHELPGLPMTFSEIPTGWYSTPAPTLGQHNTAVLRDVLGVSDQELIELAADGIIGERPIGA